MDYLNKEVEGSTQTTRRPRSELTSSVISKKKKKQKEEGKKIHRYRVHSLGSLFSFPLLLLQSRE